MEANYPYDIKNQRGASKIPLVGGILRSKAPSRGLWMPEVVLYGIRLLAPAPPLLQWRSLPGAGDHGAGPDGVGRQHGPVEEGEELRAQPGGVDHPRVLW